jgi:hypothetical protein
VVHRLSDAHSGDSRLSGGGVHNRRIGRQGAAGIGAAPDCGCGELRCRDCVKRAASDIEAALRSAGDPSRAEQEKRYLKSDLEHFGASVPAIRKIAKVALADRPSLGRDDLVELVEALWARPAHECRMVAVELLDYGARSRQKPRPIPRPQA